jgi:hypothetical protein
MGQAKAWPVVNSETLKGGRGYDGDINIFLALLLWFRKIELGFGLYIDLGLISGPNTWPFMVRLIALYPSVKYIPIRYN